MNINEMTKKELLNIRHKKWDEDIGTFDSLIIVPMSSKELHDSGYRCMYFIAVKKDEPICKLSGVSDVLHINGISAVSKKAESWSIDCLPKSGFLRLFCNKPLKCGLALSSFEILVE